MNQAKFHIGIGIAKGSFMAHFPSGLHDKPLRRFNNDLEGRSKFIDFLALTIPISPAGELLYEHRPWRSPCGFAFANSKSLPAI